jgi:hypothetical protein
MLPALLIALVAAGIGLAIYLSHLAAQKRREALAALAEELGWHFDPSVDRGHDDEYAHFEIFRKGHSRVAYNTLRGVTEIGGRTYPVKMGDFDYKITRSTGKSSQTTTYTLSYLILRLPFDGVPDLVIRREGVFDRIAGALGFDDIDFESEEFSRRFYVKSSDKKFAYDVVHPRMMEWLLAKEVPMIDIEHGRCCVALDRVRWEPHEFTRWLRRMDEFFDQWPDYLTSRLDD